MFSKILFGVIVAMSAFGFVYYQTTEGTLAELRAEIGTQQNVINAFETRQAEQIKTIEALQDNLLKTTEALNTMSAKNAEIEGEMNRYMKIFARHDLAKLAAAKPGLIETRINKGTSDVFRTIENDTTVIDNIDN
jgi:Tfp pilus assembly protein PilO